MSDIFRWGIIGPGSIAHKFATGLRALDDAQLVAVGSRSQDRADAFADTYDVPNRHASYEALAEDPEVDAVLCGNAPPLSQREQYLMPESGQTRVVRKTIYNQPARSQRSYRNRPQRRRVF